MPHLQHFATSYTKETNFNGQPFKLGAIVHIERRVLSEADFECCLVEGDEISITNRKKTAATLL